MCVCVGGVGIVGKTNTSGRATTKKIHFLEEQPTHNNHHTESLLGVFMRAEDLYALSFIPMHHFSCSAVVAFFKRGRQRHQFAKSKIFTSNLCRGGWGGVWGAPALASCRRLIAFVCDRSRPFLPSSGFQSPFFPGSVTNRLPSAAGEAERLR